VRKPISVGVVTERIWAIYRDQAGVLLPVATVLFALQFLVALLLPTALGLILTLLFWVLAILYQGFVVEVVAGVQAGRPNSDIGSLVQAVTPVLGALLVISVLFAIGVGIGLVLIIIPGLILLTIWSVVAPVAVLERPGVLASFGRSRELVRGNGWDVFGVIVLVYVATLVISLLAGLLAAPLGHVGRDLVQWAVNVLLAPVVALSASVLYFALRAADPEPSPPPINTAAQ
jgi:uncharacterized membrane protein